MKLRSSFLLRKEAVRRASCNRYLIPFLVVSSSLLVIRPSPYFCFARANALSTAIRSALSSYSLFVKAEIYLCPELHGCSCLSPDNRTDAGLADTDDPVRNRVHFIFIHVLLLFINLVNHGEASALLLCQFTLCPHKLIDVVSRWLPPLGVGSSGVLYAMIISLISLRTSSVRRLRNSTRSDGTKGASV